MGELRVARELGREGGIGTEGEISLTFLSLALSEDKTLSMPRNASRTGSGGGSNGILDGPWCGVGSG